MADKRETIRERRFASLFCGCGGFDSGFIAEGFVCQAAYDIDPTAIAVRNQNLGASGIVYDLSLPSTSLDHLKGVDVLLAGPPCQGFSTAGKRDVDDPRNSLLVTAGKIATRVLPKVFVAENVPGVASGKHRVYWDTLREELSGHGYNLLEITCTASQAGLPQVRRRLVLLAWRGQRHVNAQVRNDKGISLREALSGLGDVPNHNVRFLSPRSELGVIASRIMPGQKLCNVRAGDRSVHTWTIPEVFGSTTYKERQALETIMRLRRRLRTRDFGDADPILASAISKELGESSSPTLRRLIEKGYVRKIGSRYDLTHTFNGKFRRLSWEQPSPTIDTRFTDPRYFLHPDELRGLTVREGARIQGFPDTFVFSGTEKDDVRLVGNAVPPPLSRTLAALIRDAILGN